MGGKNLKSLFLRSRSSGSGMTIMEIMVVLSIIVILALALLVYLRSQVLKGTDAKRKADLNAIQNTLEEYEKDHDCYPLPEALTCTPGTGLMPYLSKTPCDPSTGQPYVYETPGGVCPGWYRIFTTLDNTMDTDIIKKRCTAGCGPTAGPATYNYYVSSPNAPEISVDVLNYYGCISGNCLPIEWNQAHTGPACEPNYRSVSCYNACRNENGDPVNECL